MTKLAHLPYLSLLLVIALAGKAMAAPPAKADLVKVSIIEKIARFIDWPSPPAGQFTLCVAADHPQLAAVRTYYENTSILGLPVTLRLFRKGEAPSGCQAAFLMPGETPDMAKLRAIVDKEHVLLIGEGVDMAKWGVHIGFFPDMNKLRLEVNRKSLEASGLKASYKLLEVAKVVE